MCPAPEPGSDFGSNDERVTIFGLQFRPWTERQVVDHVMLALAGGACDRRGGWIVTPNVDIVRKVVSDPQLRQLVAGASIMVADGMPLVWASALQGTPLPERVTGASLLGALSGAAARDQRAVYLLGGAPGVADEAVDRLVHSHPGLTVSGWSPPFGIEATPEGMADIRSRLLRADPDVVFCGFGFPKQEHLIADLIGEFPHVWFVGCGAALTFSAGRIPRAPSVMQRLGIEWVHRLAQEPRRMFRRYVLEDLPFALRLLGTSALRRMPRRSRNGRRPAP